MFLGIDLGTSGVTALLLGENLEIVREGSRPIQTVYPYPNWVEQDPQRILTAIESVVEEILAGQALRDSHIQVGFANPGESVVAWDARTGSPLGPVMVWSDTRSREICERWIVQGLAELVLQHSGLPIDTYFCASKMVWLLENDAEVQRVYREGHLRLCTLDAWLAHTYGAGYITDPTTASRTQLYDPRQGEWSSDLLQAFAIPETALPEIRPSATDLGILKLAGRELPWKAALLDQVAALLGNGCLYPGEVKVTYGTGAFVNAQAGPTFRPSTGLLQSVGCSPDNAVSYIFDGGVLSAGSAMQWLVDLGLLPHAAEASNLAQQAHDKGVRFLPALQGLGAPWWEASARGVFSGLTGQSNRAALVRAVLNGIASRVTDILCAVQTEFPLMQAVRVDGGLSQNNYLLQRQADLSGLAVHRSKEREATALGVATLAGIGAGTVTWSDLKARTSMFDEFIPHTNETERLVERERWLKWLQEAVKLSEH